MIAKLSLAAGCMAVCALFAGGASAMTITFSGLVGANGSPLAPYNEGGSTVTPTVGSWFEGLATRSRALSTAGPLAALLSTASA